MERQQLEPAANLLYGITPDGSGGIWVEAEASPTGRYWMLHLRAHGKTLLQLP